jgi:EmrB/QacA subfamily drug resistance transporter
VLLCGSLADVVGRRRLFLVGLATFVIASAACGASGSASMLIGGRILQGVGAAMVFSTGLALMVQDFEGRSRELAFGVWGAITGAAIAVGPFVGGLLTEELSWRWIFFVNLPLGAAVAAMVLARVGESRDPSRARLDWPGAALLCGALFMLTFALIRGNADGWSSPPIASMLALSPLAFVAFALVELRRARPIFDPRAFRDPTFTGVSIVAFALSFGMFSMFLFITLYMQNVLGLSPLETGVRVLPLTLMGFVTAPLAGKLTGRVHPRLLLAAGLALVSAGLLLMTGLDDRSEWQALLPGFLVAGAGIGLANPPLASTAMAVFPPGRAGTASGISSTFRQVGLATGIAALGALFDHRVGAGGADPAAFTSALNEIFLVGSGVTALAAVLALTLIRAVHIPGGTMQTDPRELVTGFFDRVWNEGDLGFIDRHYTPGFVLHGVDGDAAGPELAKQTIGRWRAAFPDLRVTIDEQFAADDVVVTRHRYGGTHVHDLDGLPATGRRAEISGVTITRVDGDRIVEAWSCWDALGMRGQLGAVHA